jgi:hypothetical protein
MSVVDDFSALYTAISGQPADDAIVQIIKAACQLAGSEQDFPRYLRTIARDLLARHTREPTEIPEHERGFSWLLRELSRALPGSELRNEVEGDIFVVPSLQLAAVITRGGAETYAIVPWPEQAASSAEEPIILGTFDPTFEQVREWAYSPNMRLTAQDEVVALSQPHLLPLLIELAADPACPKRAYILAIADRYLTGAGAAYDRDLLEQARIQAARTTAPELQDWARDLAYLAEYLDGQGPVTLAAARELARITMLGRNHPGIALREESVADWWRFTSYFQDDNTLISSLYINQASGALVWSRDALTAADLSPHAQPAKRDDPLALRL